MSKIDFSRTHKLADNKTEASLGLIKKVVHSKIINFRLNATDEERLNSILAEVNKDRASPIDRSTFLKELIRFVHKNKNILKRL